MQPTSENPQTDQPQTSAPQETQPAATVRKPMPIYKALLIMFAPGIVLVIAIFLYAISNFIAAEFTPETTAAGVAIATESSLIERIINILLFLLGAVAIIAFLPCFVLGIIFLARR